MVTMAEATQEVMVHKGKEVNNKSWSVWCVHSQLSLGQS